MPDYEIDVKGAEYIDTTFVDPGPPYDPATGPPDVWYRRVLEHLPDAVFAFRHDGELTSVSDSVRFLLGHDPSDLLGTNALDLLHPDDLERAADTVYNAAQVEGWRPPRPMRLRHVDGSYATFEVVGMSLFHVEEVGSIVCVARWADDTARVDAIIGHLAAQAPLGDVVAEIVHLMTRPGWRLGVAIQFDDGTGRLTVAHTDVAAPLVELDPKAAGTPWAQARRSGTPVFDLGLATTGAATDVARAAGYSTCWAIPVADPSHEDALIVVWNYEEVEPELGQATLLDRVRSLLELALAGRSRQRALEHAAASDPLTGLGNRRAFDAAFDAALAGADVSGLALVLVDLDGFKGVNDRLGHAAGDAVLREVAARILARVRAGDVAARIGGDEFAVLCPGLTDGDAAARLGRDLLDAVARPVVLEGGDADIGASVGLALVAPGPVDRERLFREADRMLYEAKASGRGAIRIVQL